MNKQELKNFVFTEASRIFNSKSKTNQPSPLDSAISDLKLLNESLSEAYHKLESKLNE